MTSAERANRIVSPWMLSYEFIETQRTRIEKAIADAEVEAAAIEREECAKLVETAGDDGGIPWPMGHEFARLIRGRKP